MTETLDSTAEDSIKNIVNKCQKLNKRGTLMTKLLVGKQQFVYNLVHILKCLYLVHSLKNNTNECITT